MASFGTKWRHEYTQINSGKFTGTLERAHTRSLQLGRLGWSPGLLIRGDIPEKSVTFAASSIKNVHPVFSNHPVKSSE